MESQDTQPASLDQAFGQEPIPSEAVTEDTATALFDVDAPASEPDRPRDVFIDRTISKSLGCRLADDELLTFGTELAEAVQAIGREETRQVNIKAQLKAALTELEARRSRLASLVSSREEYREVPVDVWFNYQTGKVQEVRQDTGEVVGSRWMTGEERQRQLPLSK
jgi:hypothetical protein